MAEEHQPPPPHPIPCVPSRPSAPPVPLSPPLESRPLTSPVQLLPAPPPAPAVLPGARRAQHSPQPPLGLAASKTNKLGKARRSLHYRKVIVKLTNRGKLQGWERLSGKSTRSSEPDLIYISMKTWVNHFQDFQNVLVNLSQRGSPRDTFSLWGCCPSAWGVQAHSLTPAISCLPSPPSLLSWA